MEEMQAEVAVAAEDEEVEEQLEDEGEVDAVVACGEGKGTEEKDVGVGKEDHALMEGTAAVVDEIQTVAAVED